MKKGIRLSLCILVMILTVGFASISTNLITFGDARIGIDIDDFNVIFNSATLMEGGTATISTDGKTITYDNSLNSTNNILTLAYSVINTSHLYDASVSVSLVDQDNNPIDTTYYTINELVGLPEYIRAGQTVYGAISVELNNTPSENIPTNFKLIMDIVSIKNAETGPIAGLYDINDNLIADWDTLVDRYGLNLTKDYSDSGDNYYKDDGVGSLYDVLTSNDELINGKKLIIDSEVHFFGNYALASTQLVSVIIPDGLFYIGEGSFYQTDLESVVIPEGVIAIGKQAFANSQIESVVIPSTATLIDEGAFEQTALEDVTIPEGVKVIGNRAFANSPITSVTLPSTLTGIGEEAFYNDDLTSVVIPEGILMISKNTFANNPLESVVLPQGLEYIGEGAFYGDDLTSLTIPSTVNHIAKSAFYNNYLTNLVIPESVETIEEEAFASNPLTSVTFEITDGWIVDNNMLLPAELEDTSIAATYLKDTYSTYCWDNYSSVR